VLADGLRYIEAVFIGDVVLLFQLLVLKILLLDVAVQGIDLIVQLFLILLQLLQSVAILLDFPLVVEVLRFPHPVDHVLLQLLHIADALEHVGDIVDSALLHLEFVDCFVEVDGLVDFAPDELDKLASEDSQAIVLAALASF
jgi:hypothetical protein